MYQIISALKIISCFLVMFFVARLGLLLLYPDLFMTINSSDFLPVFFQGSRFDLSITLTIIGIPLLLLSLPFGFARHKTWQLLFNIPIFSVFLIFCGLEIADILYFPQAGRHIGNELLLIQDDLDFLVSYVLNENKLLLSLFIACIIGIGYLWFKYNLNIKNKFNNIKTLNIIVYILFSLLLISGYRGVIHGKPLHIVDAFESGNFEYGNAVLNGVFNGFHSSLKGNQKISKFYSEKKLQEHVIKNNINFIQNYEDNKLSNYNIVFVLMESWSTKHIDSYLSSDLDYGPLLGNHPDSVEHYHITPNFDKIAKDGIQYINFYAAGTSSIEGIQSTLTSIPSLLQNLYLGSGLEQTKITKFGEIANSLGYQTLFLQSSKSRSYRLCSIAKSLGFRKSQGKDHVPLVFNYPDPKSSHFGWDYDTFMHALDNIEDNKPFVSYIFTGTTHEPYAVLPDQFNKYPKENKISGYLNTLYYSDWSLGEFMKKAKTKPWFDNTIFIFTADHAAGSLHYKNIADRYHVPMVIYAPKIFKPRVNNHVYSHLDLMPTMLDLLGYNKPFASFGESVFRKKDDFAFLPRGVSVGGITQDGWLQYTSETTMSYAGFINKQSLEKLKNKIFTLSQKTTELLTTNKWGSIE